MAASLTNLLAHNTIGGKKLLKFEIRPENQYIFLRGAEDETPDFTVKGTVVLMTSETLQTKGVRIRLHGKRKTMHFISAHDPSYKGPPVQSPIVNKATFLEREVHLKGSDGLPIRTIKPGNHEFAFEFSLPGNIPESLEGLSTQFNTYDLKAIVDRGVLSKDLVTRKHIRIIRSLNDDPTEAFDPQEVNGDWPNKIKYSFSSGSKVAIFGTSHVVDIELTPLVEKLEIGPIKCSLKEIRRVKTIPGPEYMPEQGGWRGMWKTEQDVHFFKMTVPEGSEDTDAELQLPMYKFKAVFDLPKSLSQCRQSMHSEWFRINHEINFDVMLKNPDGHWSELRAHYAIRLFISPNLPVGEDNRVPESLQSASGTNGVSTLEDIHSAPPDYQHHQLDLLYDRIDPAGFITPGLISGSNTPGYNFSRRGSADQAMSMSAVADMAPNPEALQSRLHALQQGEHGESGVDGISFPASPEDASRNNSTGDAAAAAHAARFNMSALERMPSYGTAIRTPLLPGRQSPPSYKDATSEPPTPAEHAGPISSTAGFFRR